MAHAKNHDYHILPPSLHPFLGAVGAFIMLFGAVLWMSPNVSNNTPWVFLVGLLIVILLVLAIVLVIPFLKKREAPARRPGGVDRPALAES